MKKFNHSEIFENSDHIKKIKEKKLNYEKVILLSHQWGLQLPKVIPELIKKTESKWLWLIRFHPSNTDDEKQEVISAVGKFKNTEYEISSKVNLYHLLSIADAHLTYSSTTAIEALSFNIQTIIIHPHGHDYWKDLINEKVIIYAENYEGIYQAILNSDKKTFPKYLADRYMIRTDQQEALNSFKKAIFSRI